MMDFFSVSRDNAFLMSAQGRRGHTHTQRHRTTHRHDDDDDDNDHLKLTVGILVRLAVAGRVVFDDGPVDAVAQTLVHANRHLVGHAHKQVHEEAALPEGRIGRCDWTLGLKIVGR